MATNISESTKETGSQEPLVLTDDLRCALTNRPLTREEAYWAPPLITTGQLLRTLGQTITRSPSDLGQVLFGEMPNVPYAPEAREQLGTRRTTEQLKLIGLILVVIALIVVPILLMAM